MIADRGGPHTLVVLTDLAGVSDVERLLPAVRLARRHRHRRLFIIPQAEAPPAADDALEQRLRVLFAGEDEARRATISAGLRAQGVSVYDGTQVTSSRAVTRLRRAVA